MRDQHPVKWLLEKMTGGLCESLNNWMHEMSGDVTYPQDFIMPDLG